MSPELTRELELATDLARQAGRVTLRYFRTADLEVDRKDRNEPVTRADRESGELIDRGLLQAFPGYGILSEENRDHTSWSGYRRTWVVDPLDGTQDFVGGLDGFSVMIGLLEDFRPVLGVIHQPTTGLTFRAVRGQGAAMLEGDRIQPLRVSRRAELSSLRLVVSNTHRSRKVDSVKQVLGITDEFRIGSVGLKISIVGRDKADLYVHPTGHCKLWDICAPQVVLTEAGGRMTDLYGQPQRYAPDQIGVPDGIVASNTVCHEQVIQRIAPLFQRP